jgi:hypothetical protein
MSLLMTMLSSFFRDKTSMTTFLGAGALLGCFYQLF